MPCQKSELRHARFMTETRTPSLADPQVPYLFPCQPRQPTSAESTLSSTRCNHITQHATLHSDDRCPLLFPM
jgi:hypothetical protein